MKEQLEKTNIDFSLTLATSASVAIFVACLTCDSLCLAQRPAGKQEDGDVSGAGYTSKHSGQGGVMYRGWHVALKSASEVQKTGNDWQKVFFF